MDDAGGFPTSNAVRLSTREWIYAAVAFLFVLFLVPRIWLAAERFQPSADWRVPYEVGDDYWVFRRWANYSSSKYPFLVLGDSVIWGHYVRPKETLTHYLDERMGKAAFANLGVDGIHPVAMFGLAKYYGTDVRNTSVIVHVNPLWMSSKESDLQSKEESRLNHPRLVPQVYPRLACYNPSLADIVGVVAERNVLFFSWANHLRSASFENLNLADWTMMYPYKNPLSAITLEIPAPADEGMGKPESWKERGIGKADFAWVPPEESVQWSFSKRLIELLRARGNRVFVVIGPFNPYVLTQESRVRYLAVKRQIERSLEAAGVAYYSVEDLPSPYYADASHPLKEGYALMADALFKDQRFHQWILEHP